MSFVLLKSFLWPDRASKYSRLPSHSSDDGHAGSTKEIYDQQDRCRSSGTPFRINPRIVSDATIGLSDGLTVPFALTAGLSALGDTKVVIYGGLAELIAGGISMGLGGYLGAKSEAEAYHAALVETQRVVAHDHGQASSMVRATFDDYDIDAGALNTVADNLLQSPSQMVTFLMRFHHQLAEADFAPSRAYISGLTISAGYFFGGFTPLLPYLFVHDVRTGFYSSVALMVLALFCFGWVKSSLLGETGRIRCIRNGVQMVILGGVAAMAAMICVKSIER